jgi:hypothetical protein
MMPFSGRAVVLLALAGLLLGDRRGRQRRRTLAGLLGLWMGLLLLAPRISAPGLLALPAMNRFLPVGDLALALAAALGWDGLARAAPRRPRRVAACLASTTALLAGLAWTLAPSVAAHTVLWLPVAGLALWATGAARGFRAAAVWLLLWTGFELGTWSRALLPRGDARLFYPETTALRNVAAFTGDGRPVAHRAVGQHQLAPASLLPVYGIGDIRPHNPLAPESVLRGLRVAFGFAPDPQRYFGTMHRLDHPLLSFLDVSAVVSNESLPAPAGLERSAVDAAPRTGAWSTPGVVLWRQPNAAGRLFLAAGVDRVAPAELEQWLARMRDPRRVAVEPSTADDAQLLGATRHGASDVRVERWLPGDVTLVAGNALDGGPRLLASSLPGPTGWHAEDQRGSALDVLQVNGAYLGVRLPAAVNVVRLRFRPPGVLAGAALAGGSLLILFGAFTRAERRPARRRRG